MSLSCKARLGAEAPSKLKLAPLCQAALRITVTVEDLEIDASDRILAMSVPPAEAVAGIAARLERGGLVSLGSRDDVFEARRVARDLGNVIFHPGPPEEIPFDDAYFTKVVDFRREWDDPAAVAREISRVLVDGGRLYLPRGDEGPLVAAGLRVVTSSEAVLVLERPERPRRSSPPQELPVLR